MPVRTLALPAVTQALIVLVSLCGSSLHPINYSIPVEATQPATTYVVRLASWHLSLPPDSRTLHLVVRGGNKTCFPLHSIQVSEGADVVRLDARELEIVSPQTVCTLEGRGIQVDVSLNEPLGHRKLEGCDPMNAEPGRADHCAEPHAAGY